MAKSKKKRTIEQIWNCENAFEEPCPKDWDALTPTDDEAIRHCSECNKPVTLCTTPQQFVELGNAGECVACPSQHRLQRTIRMTMGRPSPDVVAKESSRLATEFESRSSWWKAAADLSPQFEKWAFTAMEKWTRPPDENEIRQADAKRTQQAEVFYRENPDLAYLQHRIGDSGKQASLQAVFEEMKRYGSWSFEDFEKMADDWDHQYPFENLQTMDAVSRLSLLRIQNGSRKT